ncbi:MAG: tetratricopeptide repeat protein [Bacteroidota bacterium]
MSNLRAILTTVLCSVVLLCGAQQTEVYTEAHISYKRGEDFFNKGVYGYAMAEYKAAIDILRPAHETEWEQLRMRAELGYAKSAVRLDKPDGEKLILDFIRKYSPDPLASQALMEVANYFYNARKYDKALEFYKEINPRGLNSDQRSEVYFKTGYCYFVQKEFRQAEANFVQIKDAPGDYFYPANYYYGLCKFFQTKYTEAIKAFRLVERSQQYKPHVPYYIAQIYFAQRDFEEVINYATPKLKNKKLRKLKEMNRLVGQSYFETGKYDEALPYLEAGVTRQMQEQDFYQLGYCQYRAERYSDAAENFQELTSVNSELGQIALYYLGDCRLRLNDKEAARNAFSAASRMSYDADIQEVALINYAKLSYELKFDRDALAALQQVQPNSLYYNEAQVLMSDIFVNTKNYDQAIKTLEGMPNKTPQLKEAYQQVLYLRGLQHLRDERYTAAKEMFTKSVANSVNSRNKALALYWLGDIQHQEKNYDRSIDYMNQFLALTKTQRDLPDESSIYTANYMQGYNYLKKKNYNTAEKYFTEAVNGIRRNSSFIVNKNVKGSVLGDATLRAGDCYFKRNRYNDAIKYYDAAVNARYPGFEYALFQKAIIEGLRGRNTDKIIALESLIEKYPKSPYADDGLFQLGITYQEIKQASKATTAFKQLVRDYPNSELVNDALLRLGLVAYNQGNRQAAIEYYKQVFSHSPSKEEADAALAALREIYINDMGDPDGFTAFLETVPGFDLENSEKDQLAFDAAQNAYENGNYEKAITGFTNYISRYPNGINTLAARYNRGESYTILEQYTNALRDYEWVLSQGQGRYYVDALGKAAQIAYHNEQDFQKAYDLYIKWETETDVPEDRFEAELGAMRSAYRLNNVADVQSAARKVSNNPAASDLQKSTAEFYLGKIAFDRKDYASAMSSFDKVLQLSDNEQTAEARYLIAEIHYFNRDLDKAKKRCLDNNNESSGYPYWVGKSLLLLSDVFAEQGDSFSAITVLEALIQNYEDQTDEIIPTARKKLDVLKKQEAAGSRLDTGNNFMEDSGNN